ncbi:putative co-chaperone protein p23-1 [Cocos nucifera]|uniref:Co-chaperone protein p23 n=1 Tax=Cocos nucifera TaxID=13894 RepID=A0A8K0I5E4_COCNU|nr:putative co-chaperone protein p23-1 [Cocos nucifera]
MDEEEGKEMEKWVEVERAIMEEEKWMRRKERRKEGERGTPVMEEINRRHPIVKWAQRSDKIYLTVELPDAKDVNLKLEPEGKFNFSANKDGVSYEVDLELFDKVNTKESKFNIGTRSIGYVIKKAEKKWWSRLLKGEGKPPAFLKVDWDKWIDEEDENEKAKDDMDFSKKSKKKKRKPRQKGKPLQQIMRKLKLNCISKT